MKSYFSIKEVSDMTGVRDHILRYWERKVSVLLIERDNSNRRMYTQKNIELIQELSDLIFKRHFTIEGAEAEIIRSFSESSTEGKNKISYEGLYHGLQRQKQNLKEVKALLRDIQAHDYDPSDTISDESNLLLN